MEMHSSGITQYAPHSNTIQIKITSSILSLLGLPLWVGLPQRGHELNLNSRIDSANLSLRDLFSSSLTSTGCSVLNYKCP